MTLCSLIFICTHLQTDLPDWLKDSKSKPKIPDGMYSDLKNVGPYFAIFHKSGEKKTVKKRELP